MREKSLDKSYDVIEAFCKKNLHGSRITFFTTGVIAKKYPQIVTRIAADGHEIACHYHHHDNVYGDSIAQFEDNLGQAITHLQEASGQKIKGFRAPNFSINETMPDYYDILSKYFQYDSSLNIEHKEELETIRRYLSSNINLLPVSKRKTGFPINACKSGGTFLKLFPLNSTLKTLNMASNNDIVPIIYLHPYEFMTDDSFRFKFSDLKSIGIKRQFYYYFRQYQWNMINNKTVIPKLAEIFDSHFRSGGRMDNLICV